MNRTLSSRPKATSRCSVCSHRCYNTEGTLISNASHLVASPVTALAAPVKVNGTFYSTFATAAFLLRMTLPNFTGGSFVPSNPTSITTAVFKDEIVLAESTMSEIRIRSLQDFGIQSRFDVESASDLGIQDWNNDTRDDILAVGPEGLRVFYQAINGKFDRNNSNILWPSATSLQGQALLNADELQDIIITSRDPSSDISQVYWLEYDPMSPVPNDKLIGNGKYARVGNINNDSHADIVVAESTAEITSIKWYQNSGEDIDFDQVHVIDTELSDIGGLGVGDMNNDGRLDVVALTKDGDDEDLSQWKLVWYENGKSIRTVDWLCVEAGASD